MPGGEELGQHAIAELNFARDTDQVFHMSQSMFVHCIFNLVEQIRVLADLAVLHEDVLQSLDLCSFAVVKISPLPRLVEVELSVPRPGKDHSILSHLPV